MTKVPIVAICTKVPIIGDAVDLRGIVRRITFNYLPANCGDKDSKFYFIAIWEGATGNEAPKLEILAPSGTTRRFNTTEFSTTTDILVQIVPLDPVIFEATGIYEFSLWLDGIRYASTDLTVLTTQRVVGAVYA